MTLHRRTRFKKGLLPWRSNGKGNDNGITPEWLHTKAEQIFIKLIKILYWCLCVLQLSLSHSLSLPSSSHLKACLPDRLAFHTGETTVEWYRKHAHTDRHTDSQIHTQTKTLTHRQTDTLTDIHTHIHSHTSFAFLLILAPWHASRYSYQLPLSSVPSPYPCFCPPAPALNHCCHCPFAQQLLCDNLCPHSPQTFPFVVCANPCADKSA